MRRLQPFALHLPGQPEPIFQTLRNMPSAISRRDSVVSNMYSQHQWCPTDILQLYEHHRCMGCATSRRRKCQRPLRREDVPKIKHIINELSEQRPDPVLLRPTLKRLAVHGLCVRDHQYQADALVETWTGRMRAAFWYIGTENASALSPTSTPTTRSVTASAESLATRSELNTIRDTIDDMQETLRCTRRLLQAFSNGDSPVPISPLSRISTSDISSLVLSRRSTSLSDSSERDTASPSSSTDASQTARHSATLSSSSSFLPLAPPSAPPPPQHCTRSHARRIPLDDACPICDEGEPLSSYNATETIWCKSSCGRTVHKSCFEGWHTQCLVDDRSLTCPVCRADWPDADCACQGCFHVPRRSTQGDHCAICLDVLVAQALAWCKDGCGKSVHSACFEVWQRHCGDAGREATCVSCRAVWSDECMC
ncbi:hypothetical protein ACJQWK_08331 [Exserohilum turcicum]